MTPVALGAKAETPTAHALRAEVAVTLARYPTAGLGTSAQEVPFHRSMTVTGPRDLSTVPPTAQALVPDRAETPARPPLARPGLGTSVHVVPFQCSIRPPVPRAPVRTPTAQALVAEVAATPVRTPPNRSAGLGTCRQAVPFQCSISGILCVVVVVSPTAQALVADTAATPLSSEELPGGVVVLLTRVHAVPFQRRITAWPAGVVVPPTAQASTGEMAATARKMAGPTVPGVATCVHARPFQCSISGWLPPGPYPTAHPSAAERAATP